MKNILLSLMAFILFSTPAMAKTKWSDFSLSYLNGSDYEVGDKKREVISFEYANGSTWGDTFMFFDRLMSDNGDVETYGEYNSRIHVKKLNGFIKNVYVAGTLEMGPGNNYLMGIGTDLNVPYFKFFQLNLFHRNNAFGGNNYQATVVWSVPVGPLTYTGFMDYATEYDDNAASMNLTSQLGYDFAPALNMKNKFIVGIEYVYWNNKFGIDSIDERNANLLIKYHF